MQTIHYKTFFHCYSYRKFKNIDNLFLGKILISPPLKTDILLAVGGSAAIDYSQEIELLCPRII